MRVIVTEEFNEKRKFDMEENDRMLREKDFRIS